MVDIDRSVKAYYEQTQLNEEQLKRLSAMAGETDMQQDDTPAVSYAVRLRLSTLIVAGIMVALSLFILSGESDVNLAERVAQEVAMNHNKALAVEYHADTYEALSLEMNKLDFTLQPPSMTFNQNLTLLGGRYCSIQGQLAAQIKMSDVAGRVYTLYQTRSGDRLKAINTDYLQLDQVNIRLWEERGVLFALAETSAD